MSDVTPVRDQSNEMPPIAGGAMPEDHVEDIPVTLLPEPEQPDEGELDPADTYAEGVDAA